MAEKPAKRFEDWDLWYPHGAATGIAFARGRVDPTDVMLVHAVPPSLTVSVYNAEGHRVAFGQDLDATDSTPIARLTRNDNKIRREDIWPTPSDYGKPIMLPGGEVGILLSWWNAPDYSEWRWQIELYNHR